MAPDVDGSRQSFSLVTPIDAISRFVSDVCSVVDFHVSAFGVRSVLGVVGLLCAAAICIWLLGRSPLEGVNRNLGLALLVVALLGPILWAWYTTWGIIALAPVVTGKLRSVIIAIASFEVISGVATLHSVFQTLRHGGLLATLILAAALITVSIMPLGQFARLRRFVTPPSGDDRLLLPAAG